MTGRTSTTAARAPSACAWSARSNTSCVEEIFFRHVRDHGHRNARPGFPARAEGFDGVLRAVRPVAAQHGVGRAVAVTAPAIAFGVRRVDGEAFGGAHKAASVARAAARRLDAAQGGARQTVQIAFCTSQPLNSQGRLGGAPAATPPLFSALMASSVEPCRSTGSTGICSVLYLLSMTPSERGCRVARDGPDLHAVLAAFLHLVEPLQLQLLVFGGEGGQHGGQAGGRPSAPPPG